MSVENNAQRTIDGVNEILTDRINIVEALELNGDDGLANQFVKVNPDGISQGWGYVDTADLPNNIPLSKLANMPTLTITENSLFVDSYNPKTDGDKTININAPIQVLQATHPIVIGNVGTSFIVAVSYDDDTIIKDGNNALGVGIVPYSKLNLTGEILNTDIKNDEIKDAKISPSAAIDITKLAEHKISGIALGGNLHSLTAGSHISFSTGTTYNGSAPITINATNTLPAAGNNIAITSGNVVNLDFSSNPAPLATIGQSITTSNAVAGTYGTITSGSILINKDPTNLGNIYIVDGDIGTSNNNFGGNPTNPDNIYATNLQLGDPLVSSVGNITNCGVIGTQSQKVGIAYISQIGIPAAKTTTAYLENIGASGSDAVTNGYINNIIAQNIESTTQIISPLIQGGDDKGNVVNLFRTSFETESEWFGDVFMSGGSNDSFVNSCWFFGNKNEYSLSPINWKIYAIGSGSGSTGGFNTFAHAKNDYLGTGNPAILYSKSFMDLSDVSTISFSLIQGNGMNGGQTTTSYDDLFLVWNNGVGGANFQTFPTTSSSTTGDYHYKIFDGGTYGSGNWANISLDLSSVFSAQGLTNFNNANRIAFYMTDTNGQYGITNILFQGKCLPSNKKVDNIDKINNKNILGGDYRSTLSYHPIGHFANGWYLDGAAVDTESVDDDSNSPSSMKIYEFNAGGGNPNSYSANDNNGLVSNGNHTQVYYMFDCPSGYVIEGYYISLISRTSGAHLGMTPSTTMYNHAFLYGQGANAKSEVITEATTTSGAISSGQPRSLCAFNREVAVKQRLVYGDGLGAIGTGEYGYRVSLGMSRKYGIMCFRQSKWTNTYVFRGGYIKYSKA